MPKPRGLTLIEIVVIVTTICILLALFFFPRSETGPLPLGVTEFKLSDGTPCIKYRDHVNCYAQAQ